MSAELEVDNVFIQVRDKLLKEGVKLWEKPYFSSGNSCLKELQQLAKKYSSDLNIPHDSCYAAISELQTNALEKLKQRDLFKESGLASLKIKVLQSSKSPNILTLEILLSSMAVDLKNIIAKSVDVTADEIKLIAAGRVLLDTESLSIQDIKNGQQILALILNKSHIDFKTTEKQFQEIATTKADTYLLVSNDDYYMELEDQTGNPVSIPIKERKALMVALALHEKGRSALKKDDYAKALVFFLDADKKFSQCDAQVLNLVDNYALLDLDIAWCYLCLQSVGLLPEAYDRLKRCETIFEKSYGPNLERLIAVKGTPGNEAVLFLRLHLLQAIVLFHQNKRKEALQLFLKVQLELQQLKVNEDSILALVELGYSAAEARLGLRATNDNISFAANYINENREKRAQMRKKALTERVLKKEQKKLGKCDDGKQYINPTYVKMLVNMGYNKETAKHALQKCNNIISDSIQYMQENPAPSGTRSQEVINLINDLIPELEAAGFEHEMAKLALKKYNGDIMKAVEELVENNGVVLDLENIEEKEELKKKRYNDQSNKKEEAYKRLVKDISMIDDDHLDLTLQQEEIFLNQYMALLKQD